MPALPKTKPVSFAQHGDKAGLLFVVFVLALLIAACSPAPTPTPTVTPTRTPRPSRTPFPTRTPRALPTPTGAPVTAVVTDTLRVREQPSTSARILGRLPTNTVVTLLSRTDKGDWFSIEYPIKSGQVGWIFGEVVKPNGDVSRLPVGFVTPKPPPGAVLATVKTEGDPLRVRAGPGTTYEVVARIPDTTRITLVAKLADGSWYQTVYPPDSGKTGWLSSDFLTIEGSTAAMEISQAPPTPTPGPTAVPRPTRAPNIASGASILVQSNRGGTTNLYDYGENGVIRRTLYKNGNSFGARYSPDGERIVFYHTVSTSPNVVNHIIVMDFDGGNVADLSARAGSANASDSDPDWSPDGTRIVFVRTPRAGAPELWTMNANGGNAKLLLKLSAATGVVNDYSPLPRWSPDGGRIVYAAVPRVTTPGVPQYPSIFVANINGANERQLTDNDMVNTSPVWSPDGSFIAWAAQDLVSRQNWRGWVMNASGADQRIFLAPPGGDSNNGIQPVAWRGNQVLAAGWTGNWNVFLANAGGGSLRQVTNEFSDDVPTDWLP